MATLRPSLRAAYRLHDQYGYGKIFAGIIEGNLTILYDIVEEAGGDHAAKVFERKVQRRLGKALEEVRKPLLQFLAASFGVDDDPNVDHSAKTNTNTGKPFDLRKALSDFFEIGTGWLGWSPAETWAATPAEILAAQRGLIAKLKAIHGSAEDKPDDYDPSEEVAPAVVKEGIATLKAMTRQPS